MYFKEVSLNNFRNYEEAHVSFDKKINVFLGENAQGKTNLLESLFIMGLGKSFRTNKDSDMIGFEKAFARVKTILCDPAEANTEKEIEIIYQKEGKIIRVQGIKLERSMDLLEEVYIVVFSPEDLRIIKEGPENRRRFLDRELCQLKPIYYSTLGQYKRVLKQRNALLRIQRRDDSLLGTYDEALSEYGLRLTRERAHFVKRLQEISSQIHHTISEGKEILEVRYEGDFLRSAKKDKEIQTEDVLSLLKKNREKDYSRGYTSIGPHKDDLAISVNGTDIRQFGSQGQQRTAALAMKLAEIQLIRQETGKNAILLLDDVLSELDEGRQTFLIEAMKEVQVFITATGIEEEILRRLPEGKVFDIHSGHVKRLT